jgi:hypothetical protein
MPWATNAACLALTQRVLIRIIKFQIIARKTSFYDLRTELPEQRRHWWLRAEDQTSWRERCFLAARHRHLISAREHSADKDRRPGPPDRRFVQDMH